MNMNLLQKHRWLRKHQVCVCGAARVECPENKELAVSMSTTWNITTLHIKLKTPHTSELK